MTIIYPVSILQIRRSFAVILKALMKFFRINIIMKILQPIIINSLVLFFVALNVNAQTKCGKVETHQLLLQYKEGQPLPLIKGKINNKDVTMLLDTGSSWTSLTPQLTKRLSLLVVPLDHKTPGIGGISNTSITKVKTFEYDRFKEINPYFFVINDWGFEPYFDVILSADFLLKQSIEIDIRKSSIFFYDNTPCDFGDFIKDNNVSFSVKFAPFTEDDVRPNFNITIGKNEFSAIIDTAATRSTIKRSAAKKIGIYLNFENNSNVGWVVGVGGKSKAILTTIPLVKINNNVIDFNDFLIDEKLKSGTQEAEVILGLDFLKKYNVIFDMQKHQLFFVK